MVAAAAAAAAAGAAEEQVEVVLADVFRQGGLSAGEVRTLAELRELVQRQSVRFVHYEGRHFDRLARSRPAGGVEVEPKAWCREILVLVCK